eukprot:326813-Amorphochlora_amoeboformis.AAC.1
MASGEKKRKGQYISAVHSVVSFTDTKCLAGLRFLLRGGRVKVVGDTKGTNGTSERFVLEK